MKEISADTFITLLNDTTKDEIVLNKEYHVTGDLDLNTENYSPRNVKIFKATFEANVTFQNSDLRYGISFFSCTFKKNIIFSECLANAEVTDAADIGPCNLNFDHCVIESLSLTGRNVFGRGMRITGESNIKKLRIDGPSSGPILIENSDITIECHLENVSPNELSFVDVNFACRIRIDNITANRMRFERCVLKKELTSAGGIYSEIVFRETECHNDVTLKAIRNQQLTIDKCDFKNSMTIDLFGMGQDLTPTHNRIDISKIKFGTGLFIDGGNNSGERHRIHKTVINCSQDLSGTIQFSNCILTEVELLRDNHKANIIFYNCDFRDLLFKNFSNFGNLIFSTCSSIPQLVSKIEFTNSNLGKSQLLNFDFSSFSRVLIVDSIFAGIIFSGVTWFEDSALDVGTKELRRRREVYKQLKQASESQLDRIQALRFQAEELKCLKKEKSMGDHPVSDDNMILWASQSNDFGLSWVKPLIWIVSLTIGFYVLMVLASSEKLSGLPACSAYDWKITFSELGNNAKIFPQLFNPTRNLKYVFDDDKNLGFWVYLLDAVHRIVLAFFIVQIVSAFRKYVKS